MVLSPGWTAVIGISVLAMAVVQVVLLVALGVAWLQMQKRMQDLERRAIAAVDEIRPQLTAIVEEARATSRNMQALSGDLRDRLDSMDQAARSVGARFDTVADTVQWAAANLPIPVRMSGPAAMAAWAGVRVARNLLDRARERRGSKTPALAPPVSNLS